MLLQRTLYAGLAAVFGATAAAPLASAQSYPSRLLKIVVPSPAGASSDTFARILADRMRETLGQPLIVENVPGGGGSIGIARVARSEPDGYTISYGQWASHVGASAIYPVQYDVLRDLEPIAMVGTTPLWIVARKDLPATNLQDLIAWLRARAGSASAATLGPGSGAHLCGIYFQRITATRFAFVPYGAGGQAAQDIMGGRIDLMCDQATTSLPLARAGKINAYAVMSKTRWFAAPDIPTAEEAGMPELQFSFWHGMWVPRDTPKEIIRTLNAAVVDALAHPTVAQRFADVGMEIPRREQHTPEGFAAFHRSEIEKWWPIIKAADIKPE